MTQTTLKQRGIIALMTLCILSIFAAYGLHTIETKIEEDVRMEVKMEQMEKYLQELSSEQGLVEQRFSDEFIMSLIEDGVEVE